MPANTLQSRSPRRTMAKVGAVGLNVTMTMPRKPLGLVLVADGAGDDLPAAINGELADTMLTRGFGVIEVRLLTRPEAAVDAETSALRFDTGLLAHRIVEVITWAASQPGCRDLKVGLFATGTCAAAALRAAAREPESIDAVVCRAGRPALVQPTLGRLCAETLLMVGELDTAHFAEHRAAVESAPPGLIEVRMIRRGRPMLDAPAEREMVAEYAAEWFSRTLAGDSLTNVPGVSGRNAPWPVVR